VSSKPSTHRYLCALDSRRPESPYFTGVPGPTELRDRSALSPVEGLLEQLEGNFPWAGEEHSPSVQLVIGQFGEAAF
jgi:hypothetical protein